MLEATLRNFPETSLVYLESAEASGAPIAVVSRIGLINLLKTVFVAPCASSSAPIFLRRAGKSGSKGLRISSESGA